MRLRAFRIGRGTAHDSGGADLTAYVPHGLACAIRQDEQPIYLKLGPDLVERNQGARRHAQNGD